MTTTPDTLRTEQPKENENVKRPRRWLRLLALFATFVVVGFGVLLACAQYAAQREPEFYSQAMQVHPELQVEDGDQLEREVLQLHNSTRREGTWEATFTAQQINGWLATDLEEKFPDVVPPQFLNPRMAIEPERIRLACWYKDPPTNTILSLDVDVQLMDTPNVIAVHIQAARAGVIPVPLEQVLNTVSYFAERADVELRWANMNADPVALVTIPTHLEELQQLIQLETVELRDGQIYLSGRTVAEVEEKVPGSADVF